MTAPMRDLALLVLLAGLTMAFAALTGRHVFTRFPETVAVAVSPRATALVIVAIPLLLGALDVLLYYVGGNAATISYVMLGAGAARPLVAVSTAYTFGVLLGHLYFPEYAAVGPPAFEVVGRMVVVLSPTVYALIIIGAGNGTLAAHRAALEAGGSWSLAGYMLAAAVAGGLVGRYVLPQHVAPLSPA